MGNELTGNGFTRVNGFTKVNGQWVHPNGEDLPSNFQKAHDSKGFFQKRLKSFPISPNDEGKKDEDARITAFIRFLTNERAFGSWLMRGEPMSELFAVANERERINERIYPPLSRPPF